MRIDKRTFENGVVRYVIDSSRDQSAGVTLLVLGDGIYDIHFHAGYHVRLDDERVRMIRQALQFIDGEAHKHRTAQPAHPAPMSSDGPGTFPTTATPTRSGENADGSSR